MRRGLRFGPLVRLCPKGGIPEVTGCILKSLGNADAPVVQYAVPLRRGGNLQRKIMFVCLLVFVLYAVSAWAQGSGDVSYFSKCASCHGNDGKGKTAFAQKAHIPDLAAPEVQSISDTEIYESIARGTKHKVYPHAFAMRGMTQGEVNSLVKKVREFAKK